MRGLVFAQSVNMNDKRKDATGAFIPGATYFTRKHSLGKPIWLDDTGDKKTMIDGIAKASDVDVIVYFGHGVRSGLPSADIWWKDLPALTQAVRSAAAPGCQVILFACTSGEQGCFGNQLSKLLEYKYKVWGHTCVGHSFTNPYVTSYPHEGGSPFLIEPKGPLWAKWYKLIKSKSDIWARFPFLTKEQVETEIETGEKQEINDPRRYLIDI